MRSRFPQAQNHGYRPRQDGRIAIGTAMAVVAADATSTHATADITTLRCISPRARCASGAATDLGRSAGEPSLCRSIPFISR
jgi:hypothetical protein